VPDLRLAALAVHRVIFHDLYSFLVNVVGLLLVLWLVVRVLKGMFRR